MYYPSRAISRHLLQGSRATTAVMAVLFPGIRSVRERPAVTCVISVTLHVSRKRCYSRRNKLASE
jgi:hypothetical protein